MKKLLYIDYAKGIGINLILIAHSIQYFTPMAAVNNYICSFHVALFFIMSGMLKAVKDEENIVGLIRKRLKTLLVPFCIFSLFNTILKIGVLAVTNSLTSEIIKDEMVQLFITGNGTVWFLQALFLAEIIF